MQSFKTYLVGNTAINTNGDTEIQVTEANTFTGLIYIPYAGISSLTGIEAFTALTRIDCSGNNLTSLDFSSNIALYEIFCGANQLTNLVFTSAVNTLHCNNNQLTSLDIHANTSLNSLNCAYNSLLTSLNVANGMNSTMIMMKATDNPGLTCIQTDTGNAGNSTFSKDATASYSTACAVVTPAIVTIPNANFKTYLVGNAAINTNGDGEIQVTEANAFTGVIYIPYAGISSLTGIEAFTALTRIDCSGNNLTSLDFSSNIALYEILCGDNQLTNLVFTSAVNVLHCNDNQLTSLDIHANTSLNSLNCADNSLLTSLNVANGMNSTMIMMKAIDNVGLTCIQTDTGNAGNTTFSKDAIASYSTACAVVTPAIVTIPDANFKASLLADTAINTNGDTEIQVSEASSFTGTINVPNKSITDLTGIESFTALTNLNCYNNDLTSLDVTANTLLTKIYFGDNQISSIDVTANTLLTGLHCSKNLLTSLDVTSNTLLTELSCTKNDLTSLDVSANTLLTELLCFKNELTILDVSANTLLTNLRGYENQLTILDVSANTLLTDLYFGKNLLTSLNIANGNNLSLTYLHVLNNPGLTCIQTDAGIVGTNNWYKDTVASYSANCSAVSVSTITVTGSPISSNGGTSAMSASVSPTNATDSSVTWSVNISSIATISTTGVLTAVSNGSVTVTATANDGSGITGTTQIVVSGQATTFVPVTGITVTGSPISSNGGTSAMSASVLPTGATDSSVTWSVNPTSIATINPITGVLTAVADGTVTVTATTNDGSVITGTTQIVVSGQLVAVSSIAVTGVAIATDGGTSTMSLAVLPANATDSSVVWSVDDATIATINTTTGVLTAVSNGTVTVTATNDVSGVTGTATIAVSNQLAATVAVSSISVTGSSITTSGGTSAMSVAVLPANASDSSVEWTVDDTSIVAINATTGELTSVSNGTVTVTATAKDGSGITGTTQIVVSGQIVSVSSITVTGTAIATDGGTSTMSASVLPSNTTDSSVEWSVNDAGIATINTTTGVLTAVVNGTVTVTATAKDGSGITGATQIVVSGQIVSVSSITVTGTAIATDGGTSTMSASVLPSNTTDSSVTWTVDDATIATIDASGELTAVSNGTVTVTATAKDGSGITGTTQIVVSGQGSDIQPSTVVKSPKGFSPNGDGINDEWVIESIENYPNSTVSIFNRWGRKVYEAKGYQNNWNGNSNSGSKLPASSYVYIIDLNESGMKPIQGLIYINY